MDDFYTLLSIAAARLQEPISTTEDEYSAPGGEPLLRSWCSWTTFSRLQRDAGYWTGQLPLEAELGKMSVADGGTWGQPFPYDDLAHIIIPRQFIEDPLGREFRQYTHLQDIDGLSRALNEAGIPHHLSHHALDVKRF